MRREPARPSSVFAAIYFDTSSPLFQWGALVTWQTDVAGDSDRPDTESLVIQPSYFLQLGNGLYFRGSPIWSFDLENNTYNIPIAAGIGKVIITDSAIYNIFFEPQYTILSKGDGQPQLQFFAGFNVQFR